MPHLQPIKLIRSFITFTTKKHIIFYGTFLTFWTYWNVKNVSDVSFLTFLEP
jgi:hypothetical protein